ncbi:hypothetical protein A4X03_0g6672, partial [Tilletia caries]
MLPAAMMAYNTQTQETTQEPPYKIVFARNPRVFPLAETLHQIQDQEGAASAGTVTDLGALLAFHADVQDRIICAQNRQSEEYNRRHLAWTPSIDDWVLVKTEHYKQRLDPTQRAKAKLSPKLMGPFRVAELIRPGTYQLEVPGYPPGLRPTRCSLSKPSNASTGTPQLSRPDRSSARRRRVPEPS